MPPTLDCEIKEAFKWLEQKNESFSLYYIGDCDESALCKLNVSYINADLSVKVCHKHMRLINNMLVKVIVLSGQDVCVDKKQIWPTLNRFQKFLSPFINRWRKGPAQGIKIQIGN